MIEALYKFLLVSKFRIRKNLSISYNVNLTKKTVFEGYNSVGDGSDIAGSSIGLCTYIGQKNKLSQVIFGRFCSIGNNISANLGVHPTKDWVSTHPAFFSNKSQCGISFVEQNLFEEHHFVDDFKTFVVSIGNDVWIGNNVLIMDGICIGDGSIVAAGAVVTKDVEAYSIVGGVPAKHIKYRFSKPERDFLLKLKWWNKDITWLKKHSDYFNDLNKLKGFFEFEPK